MTAKSKVLLVALLAIVFSSGCNQEKAQLQNENQQLKERVAALEKENRELKETADYHYEQEMMALSHADPLKADEEYELVEAKNPDSSLLNKAMESLAEYHYKRGSAALSVDDLTEAKEQFGFIASKCSQSRLMRKTKEQLMLVEKRQRMFAAQERARQDRKEREEKNTEQRAGREEAEHERLNGTPIDYLDFYAKANASGLPAGKRYRFRAEVQFGSGLLFLNAPDGTHMMASVEAAFDDQSQYESLLKGPNYCRMTVVASMGESGHVLLNGIEGECDPDPRLSR